MTTFPKILKKELLKFDITNAPLSKFNDAVLSVLDKHAPKKLKYIRSSNCNFVTKEMRKGIMNRSKVRNKFLILETRNLKGAIIAKEPIRPIFSERSFHKESIILNNNNKTISNNEELAKTFNKHFSKLVESLDIGKTLASNIASLDITDPVFNAIKKYENYPSVNKIKHFMSGNDLKFSFIFETKNKILAEIHSLDNKKACQESDIPVKIIKDNKDIFPNLFFITSVVRYLIRLSPQN